MQLVDKQSYLLPVKDMVEEGRNLYYIVENDGVEYKLKLYDFQKTQPRPSELKCLARTVQNSKDEIYLVQDYSAFLDNFYQLGHVYPFKVVSVHLNQQMPYYQVRDRQGFSFRLMHEGHTYLEQHDSIKCRVEHIQGYKMRLKLVTGDNIPQLRFFTARQIAASAGCQNLGRLFERFLVNDPRWANVAATYSAHQGEWVLRALDVAHAMLEESAKDHPRYVKVLQSLTDIGLFLLEGSDFLRALYDDDRAKYQKRLEKSVGAYQTQLKALNLLHTRRDEDFVTSVLTKMRHSGYLYNPGENLDLLMAVFALRPETVDKKMTDILDIIIEGSRTNWMLEPFRSAFLRQLDYYVTLAKERSDRASYEDSEGRGQIEKMMRVLALQQLMTLPSDEADLTVNRSSLCRYLTYGNNWLSQQLLEKAFLAVTDNLDSRAEFKWDSVDNFSSLAMQVAGGSKGKSALQSSQAYEGNNTRLHITGRRISLAPANRSESAKAVLPSGLLPWHDIQVYCSDRINPITADVSDYRRLSRFWQEVEQSLFNWSEPEARTLRKRRPSIGETVDIVVDEVSVDGQTYYCHIVSDTVTGEGRMTRKDIVPWNIEGLQLRDFCNEQGHRYRLRADVVRENADGDYEFTLMPHMREYTNQTCGMDDEFTVKVFTRIENKYYDEMRKCILPGYVGISAEGDSIMCIFEGQEDPQIAKGEVIVGVFDHVTSKGQVVCSFDRREPGCGDISHLRAFDNLMMRFNEYYESGTEAETEETDDNDEPQTNQMDQANVRELIRIIDRVATLEESKIRMYNYLAFCRLMSRLIGDDTLSEYYGRRMSFLDRLKTFLDTGKVDMDTLNLDDDGYMDYPRLQKEILQLKVLSYFDHPERNDELWRLATETNSDNVRQLAKLALLSNMSIEFKFNENVRDKVNKSVSQLLNIPLKLPTLVSFGREETQELEFKSSYITPADTLRPDPDRQRDHIMQRICGFLNSERGGTLYIGVNDYGVASGLEGDLRYFGGSRDKFALRVRNDIRNHIGPRANGLVTEGWCDSLFPAGHVKDVYRLEIRPCPGGIKLGEHYWVRQGTSTYRYNHSVFNQILSDRKSGNTQAEYDHDEYDEVEETVTEVNEQEQAPVEEAAPAAAQTPDTAISVMDFGTDWNEQKFGAGFSTGKLRPNPCHDWEPDYVVPRFFVHFHGDDGYEVSQEASYETDKTIAVQEGEQTHVMVCVYKDGTVMTVPVSEFEEKERDKRYSRFRDVELSFASVAKPTDKLLLVYRYGNMRYARIENLADLRLGSLTDIPQPVTSADFDEVVACEVVPGESTRSVRTLLNVSTSTLGKPLDHPLVSEFIDTLGIAVG